MKIIFKISFTLYHEIPRLYCLRYREKIRPSLLLVAKWYEKNKCNDYVKRRLPVLSWLPRYRSTWILQDALAGITVGLTAVPQGIAYGIVAGLNAEVKITKKKTTVA